MAGHHAHGADRAVVGLLEPGLSDRDRLTALLRWFPSPTIGVTDILRDLIEDRDSRWRSPWICACAAYVLSTIGDDGTLIASYAVPAATSSSRWHDQSITSETIAGLRRRVAAPAISAQ